MNINVTMKERLAQASVFEVEVSGGGSSTRHAVEVRDADAARLGGGAPAEDLVRRSFEFLLAREPKGSILRRFDLMDIARYYPEFEKEIVKL